MKYILGVLAVVIILFAAIFWIVTSGPDNRDAQEGDRQVMLLDYANTGAVVSYNVAGEIVGEEQHRQITITIDRNQRKIDIISGYDGRVIRSESYPNTSDAFEEFIYALHNAGFTRETKARYESVQGVCPDGRRMQYRVQDDNEEVSYLWSTSCSGKDGTFGGERDTVENLFEDQIPEYRELTKEVRL